MKRQFVIECDSEYLTAAVYEVEKGFDDKGDISYSRGASEIFYGFLDPKFYGQLAAVLFTRETIKNAPPLTPELPAVR